MPVLAPQKKPEEKPEKPEEKKPEEKKPEEKKPEEKKPTPKVEPEIYITLINKSKELDYGNKTVKNISLAVTVDKHHPNHKLQVGTSFSGSDLFSLGLWLHFFQVRVPGCFVFPGSGL